MTTEQTKRRELLVTPEPGIDPTVARWLWLLTDARKRTLEGLDGMTDRVVNWMPPNDGSNHGGHNIGSLLYHMALIELDWLYVEILEQPAYDEQVSALLPYSDRDANGHLTVVNHESLQTHLARLAAGRQLLVAALQQMRAEEFYRVRHLDAYDVTPEWVLHHLMQHEAEHRGEILEIRRRATL
ncbi:MAG: DinB family protein, partial [Caldilineaceae bacterium]|nr:DinB family protein [Caldilineaceae bacterium]